MYMSVKDLTFWDKAFWKFLEYTLTVPISSIERKFHFILLGGGGGGGVEFVQMLRLYHLYCKLTVNSFT